MYADARTKTQEHAVLRAACILHIYYLLAMIVGDGDGLGARIWPAQR